MSFRRRRYDIFICNYETTGLGFAEHLRTACNEAGHLAFVAKLDIKKGDDGDSAIQQALRECKHFVLILTSGASRRKAVNDEIAFAVTHHKHIVPCKHTSVGNTEYRTLRRIGKKQYLHFDDKYELVNNVLPALTESRSVQVQQRPRNGASDTDKVLAIKGRELRKLNEAFRTAKTIFTNEDPVLEHIAERQVDRFSEAVAMLHHLRYSRRELVPEISADELGERLLDGASEVMSVSYDEEEFWSLQGEKYLNLNKRAIERGASVRRIFLFSKKKDEQKLATPIRRQRRVGIRVRKILLSDAQRVADDCGYTTDMVGNMLLVRKGPRLGYVSRTNAGAKMLEYLNASKATVNAYSTLFEKMWSSKKAIQTAIRK